VRSGFDFKMRLDKQQQQRLFSLICYSSPLPPPELKNVASAVSFWDKIYRKDRAISRDRHRISMMDGLIDFRERGSLQNFPSILIYSFSLLLSTTHATFIIFLSNRDTHKITTADDDGRDLRFNRVVSFLFLFF
jgi:hypothetical protein